MALSPTGTDERVPAEARAPMLDRDELLAGRVRIHLELERMPFVGVRCRFVVHDRQPLGSGLLMRKSATDHPPHDFDARLMPAGWRPSPLSANEGPH